MLSDRERHVLVNEWSVRAKAPVSGWDFEELDGEFSADEPDWGYSSMARELLVTAEHALDMGTGGGEVLLSLRDALPEDTVATEGWPPNVGVATAILGPNGIDVVRYDAEADSVMPFDDGRFDLVLNRHEAFDPNEVHRVLGPAGLFLTQQVDGRSFEEARRLFGGSITYPHVTVDRFRRDLEAAGFVVEFAAESIGTVTFHTVSAMVRYFTIVPWDVPDDFTVDRYAGVLLALHETRQPLTFTSHYFILRARRSRAN